MKKKAVCWYSKCLCGYLLVLLLLPSAYFYAADSDNEYPGLVVLRHAGTVIGLKLDAGGRAMLLKCGKSDNVLYSERKLWDTPPPPASASSPWKGFNGHVTWIAPQEHFWTRQDIIPENKKNSAPWPPDPFIIYARAHIVSQTENSITVECPGSPVSGLQLRKEYHITADGSVRHRVTARNIRKEPVSFNLWSNTRINGSSLCFVKIANNMLRLGAEIWSPYVNRSLDWSVAGSWFYFIPRLPGQLSEGVQTASGKAYLYPKEGRITAFGSNFIFIKSFKLAPRTKLYGDQGQVEIFQRCSRNPEENIAELEFYGEYCTLEPGGETFLEELWQVKSKDFTNSPEKCVQWLKINSASYLKRKTGSAERN